MRKAIIPLGGLGTRLYPLTADTSKAMVRFLNRPLIEWMISSLARQGLREVYLAVSGFNNYIPLIDYMGGGERIAFTLRMEPDIFRVRYMPNITSLGNAHAVKVVMEYYGINEPVLVLQGDTVARLDVLSIWVSHFEKASFMSVGLKELEPWKDVSMYGVADVDEEFRIRRFVEKPKTAPPSRFINTGVYVLSPQFLEFFKTSVGQQLLRTGQMDFGRHVIPTLLEHGYKISGFPVSDYWFDIGTPETYMEAVFFVLRNISLDDLGVTSSYKGARMQGRTPESRRLHAELIERDKSGEISFEGDILLGRHISVGSGTRISNSVIDHYTILGNNVNVENSIIMDRGVIGSGTVIRDSIIGRHVSIGHNCEIIGSVIGNGVEISNGVKCIGSKIWPHMKISEKAEVYNAVSQQSALT
ncbi:MAG: NDP-sugar synthase [Candidatus Caldarchaeum sp.]|nr:NDP-sugar synthase [Candidatus Caldarchaeum sp.]